MNRTLVRKVQQQTNKLKRDKHCKECSTNFGIKPPNLECLEIVEWVTIEVLSHVPTESGAVCALANDLGWRHIAKLASMFLPLRGGHIKEVTDCGCECVVMDRECDDNRILELADRNL